MTVEQRYAPILEVRETESGGHEADLRIVTYNVRDSYGTSWNPEVFKRSIDEGPISSVWAHESNRPIGVVTRAKDSPDHLDAVLEFLDFDSCPDARMAYEAMKKKAYRGVSFGFERRADQNDSEIADTVRIMDADLIEVSPVLRAAVPGAKVLAVRSEQAVDTKDIAYRVMARVPHAYQQSNGDGSVCKLCGSLPDIKAHTRADTTIEIRDMTVTLAADPMPADPTMDSNSMIASCDAALDAAIAVASYQDLTNLPAWVAQMLALVIAADACVDSCMEMMGIPDPDEADANIMRAFPVPEQRNESSKDIDPEINKVMVRLDSIATPRWK